MLLLPCKDVDSVMCLIVASSVAETTFLQRNRPPCLCCNSLFNSKVRSRIVIGIVVDFFELDDLLLIVDSYTSNLDRFALIKLNHLSRARQVEEELIINN